MGRRDDNKLAVLENLKHSHVQIIDNGINAVQEQPQRNCSEEKKNKPLKNRLELCLLDCMKAF